MKVQRNNSNKNLIKILPTTTTTHTRAKLKEKKIYSNCHPHIKNKRSRLTEQTLILTWQNYLQKQQ